MIDGGKLSDMVVAVWVVCYNSDQDQVYTFTNKKRATVSVLSSVRDYVDPVGAAPEAAASAVRAAEAGLRASGDSANVKLSVDGLSIGMHRFDMDKYSELHSLLSEVVDVLGGEARRDPGERELRRRLLTLFRRPNGLECGDDQPPSSLST